MLIKTGKDLEVFKKAYRLSLEIHHVSLSFPKIEQFALADQLRRSSKSVCANIIEGFAKQSSSKAEFKRFLVIAIASAHETDLWLDYARDLRYLRPSDYQKFFTANCQTIAMLTSLKTKS
jgi:four helix bundle protein